MASARARAPGRPKRGSIPSGDRRTYSFDEGPTFLAIYIGSKH